jgi:hypothetical protein
MFVQRANCQVGYLDGLADLVVWVDGSPRSSMADWTQRAGTITPVKSKLVVGSRVGDREGG